MPKIAFFYILYRKSLLSAPRFYLLKMLEKSYSLMQILLIILESCSSLAIWGFSFPIFMILANRAISLKIALLFLLCGLTERFKLVGTDLSASPKVLLAVGQRIFHWLKWLLRYLAGSFC